MNIPAYAEFAVRSNFSFLQGASSPEELAVSATRAGLAAFGLADRNSVAGVVRAWQAAKIAGISYHPGCRLVFCDGTPDILAYPQDRKGWGQLCRMLTQANERGEKGDPRLDLPMLIEAGAGISLIVLPDHLAPASDNLDIMRRLNECFSNTLWIGVSCRHDGQDRYRLAQARALAGASKLPLMAVNDVLYHEPSRRPLQDVVTAIRLKTTVTEAGFALNANGERFIKPAKDMLRLFRDCPEALAETLRFAATLAFDLSELRHVYPDESEEDPQAVLERLTWEGARWRYPSGVSDRLRAQLRAELDLISQKLYAPFFLTVHDIVRFAREKRILCQGRGSAANSSVCFCLGITDVDPEKMDVLFERFISTERDEPPDIDVDFEHDRRDEVMAYVFEKYSAKRTALAAAVTTYRGRSALREVAKAMGLSEDVVSALAGSVWGWSTSRMGKETAQAAGLDMADPRTHHLIERANEILEFPRHLTQHVGGFVITQDRLDEIVPIVRTAMEERRMVEWDKDDLDSVGILKVDILALGMLSCLRRCFDLLEAHYLHHWQRRLDLADLHRMQEPAVYDMICRADTIGVFQVESRAQMSMLPRLRPREFYDLVIEVAIVRPGPIQGDMVHPYLRRRQGLEPVDYPTDEMRAILGRTLGVPLFQEQAMKIAIVAGGFSPAEADQLRRAMATFRRNGTIGNYERRMVEGMVARGYERGFAERCFNQIKGFGEYGFPESHAASFALLVYASCWFKAYYPDVFCAAILNSQPMGFYAPAQLVRDAREHGVALRAPDINHSHWNSTIEEGGYDVGRLARRHVEMRGTIRTEHSVRLGLRQIKGLSEKEIDVLVAHRGTGYASVRDLWLRSGLRRATIEKLADADCFRSIGLDRRAALWAVRGLDEKGAAERLPLFERPALDLADREPETLLPAMPASEHVVQDYRSLSLSLKAHPVSFLRERLSRERVVPNGRLDEVANGRRLSVCGIVLIRQRPGTAKGVIFMTIEDETGSANIIVWKDVFARYRPVVLGARLVRVRGRLQSASGVIHVVAEEIEDLSPRLQELSEAAGVLDFRSPTDEVKRPVDEDRRILGNLPAHHRPGFRRAIADLRAKEDEPSVSSVMPRGRNFH
jgi:error-prone DNA polymerase